MSLPYLKVKPEKAIKVLDECIVGGYQVKDKITQEYYTNTTEAEKNIPSWHELARNWTNQTLERLSKVFVSQKELYNFRDAAPPFGATSENVQYVGIVQHLKARIDKLNEYDAYIRNEFNVKVEVVGRDKIVQKGDKSIIKVSN